MKRFGSESKYSFVWWIFLFNLLLYELGSQQGRISEADVREADMDFSIHACGSSSSGSHCRSCGERLPPWSKLSFCSVSIEVSAWSHQSFWVHAAKLWNLVTCLWRTMDLNGVEHFDNTLLKISFLLCLIKVSPKGFYIVRLVLDSNLLSA